MTTESTNTALVRHLIQDLWHTHAGLETLKGYIAPGYVHHAASGDFDFAAFQHGLGSFIDACPDLRHEITHIVATGDLVAVHARMIGTQTGPFGSIAPTGKRLTWTGMYHCHLVAGQLVEDWDSWTVLPLFQQTAAVLQA